MFDKKEMKLVNFKKAQKLMMEGVVVYLVQIDGSLEELTIKTEWQKLLFHNLKSGNYAIYRKKLLDKGAFHKNIRIGKSSITIDCIFDKGGESE
ncbi:MAG: hypothetical protein LHW64_08925 [Candidatus Cloacimonetes bacterium]|nr:hypothetical protein [Candidatus Cloacimonadota bacterium]MDY0230236.1 hypothetical protein [Candidatus Cloacimonadaceae bacterium]